MGQIVLGVDENEGCVGKFIGPVGKDNFASRGNLSGTLH